VLQKLRERAIDSFNAVQRDTKQNTPQSDPDELEVLGGRKSATTSSASDSGASGLDRQLSELSNDFARHTDPSIIQYRALANPALVLPATRELKPSNIPPPQPLAPSDTISQEDITTPSPFFDPALKVAMTNQGTYPVHNIAGPSMSMPQQQLWYQQVAPQHPHPTEAYKNVNEEAWRNYVSDLKLGAMKP